MTKEMSEAEANARQTLKDAGLECRGPFSTADGPRVFIWKGDEKAVSGIGQDVADAINDAMKNLAFRRATELQKTVKARMQTRRTRRK